MSACGGNSIDQAPSVFWIGYTDKARQIAPRSRPLFKSDHRRSANAQPLASTRIVDEGGELADRTRSPYKKICDRDGHAGRAVADNARNLGQLRASRPMAAFNVSAMSVISFAERSGAVGSPTRRSASRSVTVKVSCSTVKVSCSSQER